MFQKSKIIFEIEFSFFDFLLNYFQQFRESLFVVVATKVVW